MFFKKISGLMIVALISVAAGFLFKLAPAYAVGFLFLISVAILSIYSPLLYLVLLVVFYGKFYQTFDPGFAPWLYFDVTLIILMTGLCAQLFREGVQKHFFSENPYFRYTLIAILIVQLSIIVGSGMILDQPFKSLMFRSRWFLFYLVFTYLLLANFNRMQIAHFVRFLVFSSVFISLLVIIDTKLLGGGHIFKLAMKNGVSGFRLGVTRIYINGTLSAWAYFYLLSSFFMTTIRKKKIFYILCLLPVMYDLFFIGMTRQIILGLMLSTAIFFWQNLRGARKIVGVCIICALVAAMFVLNSMEMGSAKNNIIAKMVNLTHEETKMGKEGSVATRVNALKFFYPYFQKTPFVGMGMLSSTYKASPVYMGERQGYFFADLGIFSTILRFGILSLIFIFIVLKRSFNDLAYVYKNSSELDFRIQSISLKYLLISWIIVVPASVIFFNEGAALYYSIIFYIIYRLKLETQETSRIQTSRMQSHG